MGNIDYIMSLYESTKSESRVNFKVVIVGERGVGKTSLALRYVKGIFNKSYAVTVGVEFYSKNICVDDQHFCLQLWDTAGQESFKSLVKSFYNHAGCIILTYCNPTRMAKTILSYLEQIGEHAAIEASVFVVRTKTDLSQINEDERSFLNDLLTKRQIAGWMDVSAKDGKNVEQFFQAVSEDLIEKFKGCLEFRELVTLKHLRESISLKKQSVLQTSGTKQGKKRSCCE